MTATYRLPPGPSTAARSVRAVRIPPRHRGWRFAALALLLGSTACAGSPSEAALADHLVVGTWGANGAGVIVTDTLVHVHIGCTNGNFPRPSSLDDGRFNVAGTYMLRAYPVAAGPELPARMSGVVRGSLLTLSVAVDDTVSKQLAALGPVTVVLGREPVLGPCPICVIPGRLAPATSRSRWEALWSWIFGKTAHEGH